MVDFSVIGAVATSGATLIELLKVSSGARDEAKIQAAVQELNKRIIEAQNVALQGQTELFKLQKELKEAQEKVAASEKADDLLSRYELFSPKIGSFVYRLKTEYESTEPSHLICPKCYQNKERQLLQEDVRYPGRKYVFHCVGCKSDFHR